jgi:hypothetical protein
MDYFPFRRVLTLIAAAVTFAGSVAPEEAFAADAVASKPVLDIVSFASQSGIPKTEIRSIQDLIVSYIDTYKVFQVRDPSSSGSVGSVPAALPAYVLQGSLSKIQNQYLLSVEMLKSGSQDSRQYSERFESVNSILLRYREFVRAFMERVVPLAQPLSAAREIDAATGFRTTVMLEDIVGIWQGDKGLTTVKINKDGSGAAGFPDVSMQIKVRAVGGTVLVDQDQANVPEFYQGPTIGLALARAIAVDARPMKWIFRLSADGLTLTGIKETTSVEIVDYKIKKLDNSYTRESVWTKNR